MQGLQIKCEGVSIETRHGTNDIVLDIQKPDLDFLGAIPINDLVKGYDNRELFKAIIENDEDIFHGYLISHGYMFSKN